MHGKVLHAQKEEKYFNWSIVFIISFAACISLSIQSALRSTDSAKEGLSVTTHFFGVDNTSNDGRECKVRRSPKCPGSNKGVIFGRIRSLCESKKCI